ncbi:MAG: DUF748 domain-containing protein, partial [Hylemonella sp.]|nr:DUF748 domain-containing protein [Hylemonella sp.]
MSKTIAAPFRSYHCLYRGLGAAVLVMFALAAASYFWVPWVIKSQLPKLVESKLGRAMHVGKVSFKPWSLDLRLNDLVLAGQTPGSPPLMNIASVQADVAWASVWRLSPIIDALNIDAPQLHLKYLGAGRYDVDDLLVRLAKPVDASQSAPVRFALYNMSVRDGAIDFVDMPVERRHVVKDLKLGLPFLSSLPVFREVNVEPALSFSLNGGVFDTKVQSRPFASNRQSDVNLSIDQFDLRPYLDYLPKGLPVHLTSGVLGSHLKIAFDQSAKHALRISGWLELRGLGLGMPNSGATTSNSVLNLQTLRLNIKEFLPLEQRVHLDRLELVQPQVFVARQANGTLALLEALKAGRASPAEPAIPEKIPHPWSFQLDQLSVAKGAVTWRDASTSPAAQMKLVNVQLELTQLAWPFVEPTTFKLEGDIGADGRTSGRLSGEGSATPKRVDAKLHVGKFDLATVNPYLSQWLRPTLAGQLNSDVELKWHAASPDGGGGTQTVVNVADLTLDQLALTGHNLAAATKAADASGLLASIHRVKLSKTTLDLEKQDLTVGSLLLDRVNFPVNRAEDGRWMAESWMNRSVSNGAAAPAVSTGSAPPSSWRVAVSELRIEDAHVPFVDKSAPRPVRLDVSAVKLKLNNWVLGSKTRIPFELQAKVGSGRLEPGNLVIHGNLLQEPWGLDASVSASRLPVHPVSRYLADSLSFDLLRADTSFKGNVKYSHTTDGPLVSVNGDAALEEFLANIKDSSLADKSVDGDELLSWKALGLRGLSFGLSPGTPMQLEVRETALSDFYARLILRADGTFNLQDLSRPAHSAAGPTAMVNGATGETAPETKAAPAHIRFGGITLVNGKVYFSDHFIQPNYSADLTELTGRLGAFSSQQSNGEIQMADLELRGRAEGSAMLEILGKLNPLAKPLALDVKGMVRELELPPLSAYSVKYAGHAIERGKLSLDVNYRVLPTGELTANNKLVLNSLKFGEKVEGAKASLPVKLAVALLADSDGVIDLDLPISGSLNDPQFRLSSVFFKVLGNVFVKAITSPFSLLTSSLGGGAHEMSNVSFAPGSSRLTEPSRQSLDKLATVLESKSKLLVTVVGLASLDAERDAYKHERLQALIQAERRRAAITGSKIAIENIAENRDTISLDEYEALLKRVYRRANIVKPRNLVGLVKDISVPEMEALLLANLPAT